MESSADIRAVVSGDIVASTALDATHRARLPLVMHDVYEEVRTRRATALPYELAVYGGDSWQAFVAEPVPLAVVHRDADLMVIDKQAGLVMAASAVGIYRSADGGKRYERCSAQEFSDRVTLPETWLFCSDEHEIEVSHDAAL